MSNLKINKVLILAGGYGSRLEEYTKLLPKPMVKIGRDPILLHVMRVYLKYGVNNFYIALGYKGEEITKFFLKKRKKIKDFIKINFKLDKINCFVTLINTGLKTMTGGRLKKAAKFIDDKNFFFTYGDGLANVNIKKLTNFHLKNKKIATVTAVNPPARFGEISLFKNKVVNFSEKKKIMNIWINGGFFVINKKFLKYINKSSTILEREPLEKAAKLNQLAAFKHYGFWQCMDTKRDRDKLIQFINKKDLQWLKN